MKTVLKRLLPRRTIGPLRRLWAALQLPFEYFQDMRRYATFGHPAGRAANLGPVSWLEAEITKDYHRVEKGLSLGNPRRPFGDGVAERLRELIPVAEARQPGAEYVALGRDALRALDSWNEAGRIDPVVSPPGETCASRGVTDAEAFFRSRHSVRHFAVQAVPEELLRRAVLLAMASPSECNRQPWRVRFYRGEDVPRVARHQNGNRGFTHEIPVLALITVDLGMFTGVGERNQAWIAGGIFATTLMWALHALGLDSCMLNLSVGNRRAAAIRRECELSGAEVPIMMLAIGYAAEPHRVARSQRRQPQEIAPQWPLAATQGRQ